MKKSLLFLSYILFYSLSYSQQPVSSILPNAITVLPANDAIATNGIKIHLFKPQEKQKYLPSRDGPINSKP